MLDQAQIVRSLFDFFVQIDPANADAYAALSVMIVVTLPFVLVGGALWFAESRSLTKAGCK